jgi:hypothetical protein
MLRGIKLLNELVSVQCIRALFQRTPDRKVASDKKPYEVEVLSKRSFNSNKIA